MTGTILYLGDDTSLAQQIQQACDALGLAVVFATSVEESLASYRSGAAELVVCDLPTFESLRKSRPGLYALLIIDRGDSRQTIEAMRRGALDCLVKPVPQDQLSQAIERAISLCRDAREVEPRRDGAGPAHGVRLVGQSPAMQELYKRIGLIAASHVNVLITGESGTGKELVARAVYDHSARHDKTFLAVNCAAIPETLLESELFGHERGAFTGADRRRIGKFEACDGGTLFLDEIGDIPLSTQAKLLRVLQDHAIQRLGGNESIQCDVRVIAATHQHLEQRISEGRFREDLYYRLKVATIEVPPLREREVDAVLLAHFFVNRLTKSMGSGVTHFDPPVVSALLQYPWPGNVRELENAIKSALVVSRGPVLRLDALPDHIRAAADAAGKTSPATRRQKTAAPHDDTARSTNRDDTSLTALIHHWLSDEAATGNVHARVIAAVESELIKAALDRAQGQVQTAARILGISRTTLRKKMREAGITIRPSITGPND